MENPILDLKKELIQWVNLLDDLDVLSNLKELKDKDRSIPLLLRSSAENSVKTDFDEQFAAGMTGDELLENIAAHMETMASEEHSAVVSDTKSEYAVKVDFDERFAKGLTPAESRKRTREFISSLPWKK
ncbi:hypothetical protein [Chryseobacterium sp. MP_3.2]|uniref:hypothetical protein n=1 Tax=Chryseobacterium sp. MP_3.2 TaxID=3071712 RepID=UPI002DFD3266|nr:hypothetical protein [Chryseobacterium sp. MP_3.2]